MRQFQEAVHQGAVHADRYSIDTRLNRLGLTFGLLAEAARQGDLDRRGVPAFPYEGHPEYAAGSRIRSALCEMGGTTDGGWHAGRHLGIPVAFNHTESVAIHATGGTEGTGRAEGSPHNRSLKGPWSRHASAKSEQLRMGVGDDEPVDFWWFFTLRDDDGLWAELYAPVIEEGGYSSGWIERIVLGHLGDPPKANRRAQDPNPVPSFDVDRRPA